MSRPRPRKSWPSRMARIRPQQLVIDTDVTGAAGPKAGISLACARFLEAVRETGHRIVRTDTLRDEWNRHRSNFAASWLRTMYARRKVDDISVEANGLLRTAMILDASEAEAEIMLKDVHLIEAAMATARRVVSREVACRACFVAAAVCVAAVRTVCWVNPAAADEEPVEWLRRGAPLDPHRLLGFAARRDRL